MRTRSWIVRCLKKAGFLRTPNHVPFHSPIKVTNYVAWVIFMTFDSQSSLRHNYIDNILVE
jgi:hypothetical protein